MHLVQAYPENFIGEQGSEPSPGLALLTTAPHWVTSCFNGNPNSLAHVYMVSENQCRGMNRHKRIAFGIKHIFSEDLSIEKPGASSWRFNSKPLNTWSAHKSHLHYCHTAYLLLCLGWQLEVQTRLYIWHKLGGEGLLTLLQPLHSQTCH